MQKGQNLSPREPPPRLRYESVAELTAPGEPQLRFTKFKNSILVQKRTLVKLLG